MKLFYFIVVSWVVFTMSVSCENDLDLTAPHKDIPVVYGILCPFDTAQYLRLERAFIDSAVPGEELARIPDSFYYENAVVTLTHVSSGQSYLLEMVDGIAEGFIREQGIFNTQPNYLYKISSSFLPMNPGDEYLLQIVRTEASDVVTASTVILAPPLITRPSSSSRLDFDYADDFIVRWSPGENAAFHDVVFHIHYREIDRGSPDAVWKAYILEWNAGTLIEHNEISQPGVGFYQFLADHLTGGSNQERIFTGIDLYVHSGDQELYNYINSGQANIGLSSSLDIPRYSNLSEGLGIFSAKSTSVKQGILITTGSLDSLRNGRLTRHLNFQ